MGENPYILLQLCFVCPFLDRPLFVILIQRYNAYPQINDGIYSWINDETDPETVYWNDAYLGETNVREKWELIQSNYVESTPNKNYGVVQIIIGAFLLLASLFLLAIPTWRLLKGRQTQ